MKYLWNRPENDSDYVLSQTLSNCNCGNNEFVEEHLEIHRALCQIYYDVFNNGGCNLGDNYLAEIEKVTVYAKSKGLDVPVIVEWLEPDPEELYWDSFESIECEPMDKFAREVIRNIYADLLDRVNSVV